MLDRLVALCYPPLYGTYVLSTTQRSTGLASCRSPPALQRQLAVQCISARESGGGIPPPPPWCAGREERRDGRVLAGWRPSNGSPPSGGRKFPSGWSPSSWTDQRNGESIISASPGDEDNGRCEGPPPWIIQGLTSGIGTAMWAWRGRGRCRRRIPLYDRAC